jgi:hypothetical protein
MLLALRHVSLLFLSVSLKRTGTKKTGHSSGFREEVDYEKLGPALLIASNLVLAIRTARWPATHSDGLADVDWQGEVEHSSRITKIVLTHLTSRYPVMFQTKRTPWYEPSDEEVAP